MKTPGSGRKKGTPNKMTQSVMDICAEMGFDPVRGLVQLALTAEDESNRVTAHKELMKYIYPQRKAVEHSGTIDTGLQSIIDNLKDKTPEELKEIVNKKE
jgi:hypothetical protein